MRKQVLFQYIFVFLVCQALSVAPAAVARSFYMPSGVQIGAECTNALYYKYYEQVNNQQEWKAAVDFSRVIIEGNYGWGNLATGQEGQYFRIGVGYNLAPDTPDKNAAFLGVQHARSFLPKVFASWHEVVAGVNFKVWKMIYVGSTLRYKFGFSEQEWKMPHCLGWGDYGKGDDETLVLTYYISLRIPFPSYKK